MGIDAGIRKSIEAELKALPEHFIVAIVSSPEQYFEVNMAIADFLIKKRNMSGVYITMNKPHAALVSNLKDYKIDPGKMFFIDAISGVVGDKSGADNCVVLPNPSSLTELGIAVSKVCSAEKPRFLIMDSLSTMLVYNSSSASIKFVHYLTTQLRKCQWPGVIFSLEEDVDKSVLTSVIQFCDKIIRL